MRYVLSGMGVIASMAFLGASMTMNYLYGISLGRNALESQIWGVVSIASDALKALSPIFLFWACRNQRWGTAFACLLLVIVTTGYALQSAVGFASESKSMVAGSRENLRATYLEIESERDELVQRREAMKVVRWPGELEADIAAALARVVKDGTRVRGTVALLSIDCTQTQMRTVAACSEVANLRRELATAVGAAHLDERIIEMRKRARELRDKGGASDPHPQSTLLSWLTLGRWSPADVEAGKLVYLTILVELASVFGLLISVEHGELRKAWAAGPLMHGRKAERAVASHSPPLPALPVGEVGAFLETCVVPEKGSELEVGDLYAAYRAWCDQTEKEVLSVESFAEAFAVICDRTGVLTRPRGTKVFCLDVKLA